MRGKATYIKWLLCMLFVLAAKQTIVAHTRTPEPSDQPTIIYVDDDVDGLNVGTNWEHAVNSLQDALLLAYFSDKPVEIRVAQGVYTPDRGLGIMPGDSIISFQLINGVTIKGGYSPNLGGRRGQADVRDIDLYKSILSGDLNADDGPGLDTVKENSYHIVTSSENDVTAVLDGFTITGSGIVGGGTNPYNHSSGMYNDKSSPTLIDCTFTGNKATERGAGMYNDSSNPVLLNCTFSENAAPAGGAGMYNNNSSPMLTNCTFSGNSVGGHGSGMYNYNSKPVLLNCIFTGNYAGMNGGGMYNENSVPTLTNCTFTGNSAGDDGGAIYSGLTDISLSDCIFEENRAVDDGGGLIHINGNIHLTGCTFVDNSALPAYQTTHSNNWGGAMEISILSGNKAVATDCLFRNNSAVFGGAIQGNLTALRGCRFMGNVAYYRGGAIDGRGTLNCENSLFEGNKAMEHVAVAWCLGALLFTNCTFVENRSPDGYTFLASGGHGAPQDNVFMNCVIRGADHSFRPGRSWLRKTSITYSNIQGGFIGEGNLDVDPQFVAPGHWEPKGTPDDASDDFWVDGDYHLKSQAGRWDPISESWVTDDVTSPCIDAGDPNSPVAFEPFPNGGIINMGAYGGTAEASKSPSGLHAKYGGGSGTVEDPYLIYTAEQMNAIGAYLDDWDKHFKLMGDIDLSGYAGTDFNIIGIGNRNAFTGVFDGNGHTISNFTYTSSNGGYKGLFRYVSGRNAQIKELGLIAPDIDAGTGSCVGSLAGFVSSGTITNCYAEGGSVSGKKWIGGLVGYNNGSLKDCYSTCSVSGNEEVGGLVGYNSSNTIANCSAGGEVLGSEALGGLAGGNGGTIKNSFATGNVTGENRNVGGLVGRNSGQLSSCSAGGDVFGNKLVGGLVGNSSASIINCYATGDVFGTDYVGGLLGRIDDSIVNCYASGGVSGTTYVGGLVGLRGHGSTVFTSFWDIETNGQLIGDGGTGKTTAEMQDPNTFMDAGWNFVGASDGPSDIWAEPEGGGYPILWWQLSPVPELPAFSGGTGEPDDPYLISTAEELNSIGHNPRLMSAHFQLINDIDLDGINFFIIGGQWHPFGGTFDGNGHTISNFSYTSEYATCIGLFGYVAGGRIKDLGLIDPYVNVDRGDFHGCLVGHLEGGTITNCYVEAGSVSGNDYVGGLVGFNGGDWNSLGTIADCYVTGSVAGDDDVGGLVGSNGGTITDCYAIADVSGNSRVGGLVGVSDYASSSRAGGRGHSFTTRPSIERCYAAGHISGDEDVGGLAGQSNEEITHSFWDTETSGQSTSAGGMGRTTAQMQTARTFVGWGASGNEGIWTIDEGSDYPRLWWENMPGEPLLTGFYGGGGGTETNPYLIYTAEELNMIGAAPWDWHKHFKLMEDIDLAAYTGTDFNIIGYYMSNDDNKPFNGVFDGNGKTISNFSYSSTDVNNIGLFGYLNWSSTKVINLGLIEPDVAGTGDSVGPLIGLLRDGTVTGCYADGGSVSGSNSVGGLVGWNWGGTITDCYARVSVSGDEEVGGLVGRNSYTHWPGVYPGQISNCYSTGSISGDLHVGGLIGYSYIGQISNSFWDIQTSGQPGSDGGEGKTTAEMQTAGTFLDAGWDFVDETINGTENIWWILEGQEYPRLWWETIQNGE